MTTPMSKNRVINQPMSVHHTPSTIWEQMGTIGRVYAWTSIQKASIWKGRHWRLCRHQEREETWGLNKDDNRYCQEQGRLGETWWAKPSGFRQTEKLVELGKFDVFTISNAIADCRCGKNCLFRSFGVKASNL